MGRVTHASWGDSKENGFKRSIRISITYDSSTNPFVLGQKTISLFSHRSHWLRVGGVTVTVRAGPWGRKVQLT